MSEVVALSRTKAKWQVASAKWRGTQLGGGGNMFKFDCSSLGPPYIFGRTHLEMFCPKDHILFMKIGFPSGHIKNQAIPLWGSKNKIVETPSSYLSKRVREGQKTNGKRIESIRCFVFEKNPKNHLKEPVSKKLVILSVFWIFLKNETSD